MTTGFLSLPVTLGTVRICVAMTMKRGPYSDSRNIRVGQHINHGSNAQVGTAALLQSY
jgi:hypothetical protein